MFRLRPARLALLVPLALSCGCACSGDRPRLIDRFRIRNNCCDEALCCPTVSSSPVPLMAGAPSCPSCANNALPMMAVPSGGVVPQAPCESCGNGMIGNVGGPFLGAPPMGEMYPGQPIPGTYEPPTLQVPEPLPAPGIEEGVPGEAQPLPAGAMSQRGLGKVANGWRN